MPMDMVICLCCCYTERGRARFGILLCVFGFFLFISPCSTDSAGPHMVSARLISSAFMSQLVIINADDIKRADTIWGPAESVLQGKMKRKKQKTHNKIPKMALPLSV